MRLPTFSIKSSSKRRPRQSSRAFAIISASRRHSAPVVIWRTFTPPALGGLRHFRRGLISDQHADANNVRQPLQGLLEQRRLPRSGTRKQVDDKRRALARSGRASRPAIASFLSMRLPAISTTRILLIAGTSTETRSISARERFAARPLRTADKGARCRVTARARPAQAGSKSQAGSLQRAIRCLRQIVCAVTTSQEKISASRTMPLSAPILTWTR